jgi:hypothetical protein
MKKVYMILVFLALAFVGCKDTEPVTPEAVEVQEMAVNIDHAFDNEPLAFLTKEYSLASGEKVFFKRLAYLLADFYLIKADDTRVNLADQYALLNPKSDPSNFTLLNIPMGEYKAFGFSIGLDSIINHGNPNQYPATHPLSPINNSLYWSWQGGYVFTAIEGDVVGTTDNFIFHLAGSNNKIDFEFPVTFTKGMAALDANLTYNLAEAFKNPDMFSLTSDGRSTHTTTDPVTVKLTSNMADIFNLDAITTAVE